MGLSGEVAPHAPLSRDVKEGEPYQIQGELTVPILRAPGPTRFKEGETVQDPNRGTVPYSRVNCTRLNGGGTVSDLARWNCTRSREGVLYQI